MTLESGSRLANHYEIVAPIGAGGMGEVYRAHDTKLGRDVAIKVLPADLAGVQERLDRFEREAKLLAALNHANVATLYGLEHAGEQMFLVMELVEGETLAERIARGPIPFEEAQALFVQIAEGLEAAHDKGIIHRDLKPANIKITPEGKIKILDFGLAKAFATDGDASAESSQSPTLTKGTALGAIMGTAGYMSPEQARGKLVDRRTDVWAFGCCLFEALTGTRTFDGETVPDTLAAVLNRAPDWSRLPASTSQSTRRVLERALRKDVTRRLQHVGDARVELLEDDVEGPAERARSAMPWLGAAAVALVAIGFLARMLSEPSSEDSPGAFPIRAKIELPEGFRLDVLTGIGAQGRYPPLAISRDGRQVAFIARQPRGVSRVFIRSLDALQPRALDGTESAQLVFFSPDGRWVGFLADGRVSKAPVAGGVPTTIGDMPFGRARGATWASDDTIVLGGSNSALVSMDASTGELETLTELNTTTRENYHAWPQALPDDVHVLFTKWGQGGELRVVSLATKQWKTIEQTAGATQGHYLDSGHLVFFREGGLFVAAFDLSQYAIDGPIVNVPKRDLVLGWDGGLEHGYFAASWSGSLVAVVGDVDLLENELVRVDRSGRGEALAEPDRYRAPPALSPDGRRVAIQADGLFLHDLERRSRARLPSGLEPTWSADGTNVYYGWFESMGGDSDLFAAPADGSAGPEPLLVRAFDQFVSDASHDGRFLAFSENHPETGSDIHLLQLDQNEAMAFATTSANEMQASFSPDSRYLAFSSDETGRFEIYVRAVSGGGGKILVSNEGGRGARWSPQGDELFYRDGTTMMAVPIELEPTFRAGVPEPLFDGDYRLLFDVFPDGEHFAMVTVTDADLRELELVVNWSAELRELAPVP